MSENICPKCKGLGWRKIRYRDKEGNIKEAFKKCDCKYNDISDSIYRRMNIPRRYRNKELGNFEIINKNLKQVYNKIEDYLNSDSVNEGRGLFLYGSPGVGKTHLAVAVLKELFRRRKVVGLFYDTSELLMNLKLTFDGSASGREILEDIITAPVLVLDDLGAEKLSEWAKEILHYIIVKRYNELLPIIITSNIEIKGANSKNAFSDSIEERLGSSIASRIAETCEKIEIKSFDLRTNKTILTELSLKEGKKKKG